MRYTFEYKGETITVNLEPVPSFQSYPGYTGYKSYFHVEWEKCPFCEKSSSPPDYAWIWRMDAPNPDGVRFETCCCHTVVVMRPALGWYEKATEICDAVSALETPAGLHHHLCVAQRGHEGIHIWASTYPLAQRGAATGRGQEPDLSLEDAVRLTTAPCPQCNGTGRQPGSITEAPCTACEGTKIKGGSWLLLGNGTATPALAFPPQEGGFVNEAGVFTGTSNTGVYSDGKRILMALGGVSYDLPTLSEKLGKIVGALRRESPELDDKDALDAILAIIEGRAGPLFRLREWLEREYEELKRTTAAELRDQLVGVHEAKEGWELAAKRTAEATARYESALKTRKLRVVIKEPRTEREGIGEPRVYEFDAPGGVRYLEVLRTTYLAETCIPVAPGVRRLTLTPGAEFEVFELVAGEVGR